MTPACGSGYDAEAWLQSAAGRLAKEIEAEAVKQAHACEEAERLRAFAETPAFLNGLQEKLVKAEAAMKKAEAAMKKADAEAKAEAEAERMRAQGVLKEKLAMAELIEKEASANVAWFEEWLTRLRADEAEIENKRLQREADIQSAKSVVEQFPFREAETIQLYETTTFRELAEEQKRLDAKKAAAIAQHQEELKLLAKAHEEAVSQLQRLRTEPNPKNSAQEILSNTAMYDPCPSAATGERGPTNSIVGWLSHYKEKAEPAKKMVEVIKVAMATLS